MSYVERFEGYVTLSIVHKNLLILIFFLFFIKNIIQDNCFALKCSSSIVKHVEGLCIFINFSTTYSVL